MGPQKNEKRNIDSNPRHVTKYTRNIFQFLYAICRQILFYQGIHFIGEIYLVLYKHYLLAADNWQMEIKLTDNQYKRTVVINRDRNRPNLFYNVIHFANLRNLDLGSLKKLVFQYRTTNISFSPSIRCIYNLVGTDTLCGIRNHIIHFPTNYLRQRENQKIVHMMSSHLD